MATPPVEPKVGAFPVPSEIWVDPACRSAASFPWDELRSFDGPDGLLDRRLGGGLGAMARFAAGSWITRVLGTQFPWGTLLVNITGSFCVGLVMVLLAERIQPHPYWRLFLVVGFLGGYTTFSSFEYETLQAFAGGWRGTGILYVAASVIVGYAAVWLGTVLAGRR